MVSNSVIEHLGTSDGQQEFAREVRRVGKGYFVQTPNRYFPVESHLLTPFVHWLPRCWQKKLLRNFTLWRLITRPGQEYCARFHAEVRLLSKAEMAELFPGARIVTERFLGLPKSLIAIGTR